MSTLSPNLVYVALSAIASSSSSSSTGQNTYINLELTYRKSPLTPAHMDWSSHFPAYLDPDTSKTTLGGARKLLKDVEVADIGCGFGGLLVGLAPILPETLMVGTLITLD